MPRARGKVPAHARHKKIVKAAKGYYGRRKNTFRTANAAVWKAGQYAYIGRKQKKRTFRSLWIQRINAAVRAYEEERLGAASEAEIADGKARNGAPQNPLTYARFIDGLTKAGIEVDRKVMADLAIHEPKAFGALVEQARAALN